MAESRMTMVYCYDIQDNCLRRRVADLLEGRAVRVQESVFEARLTLNQANRLYERLARMLEDGDLLRMYCLTSQGLERSRADGGAPIPEAGDYWLL